MPGKPPAEQVVRVDRQTITLRNLDKRYWPQAGLSKADLIAYAWRLAPVIVPHLAGRPLVLVRYPDGSEGEGFYQKNLPDHAPDWLPRYRHFSEGSGRALDLLVCNDVDSLIWLASQGALEWHPWHARVDSIERPDIAVIDLDPAPGVAFPEVVAAARLTQALLADLGLTAYPKTSGGRGLHLFIPIRPELDHRAVTAFVRDLGRVLAAHAPQLLTLERRVDRRGRRVYVDYLQNGLGKTLVAVYSPRPTPQATVSCPVAWDELDHVRPEAFTLTTVPGRVAQVGDLFAPVLHVKQPLEPARRRLAALKSRLRPAAPPVLPR